MNNSFNSQTLTDKLTKLNNSQQSIESLSKWCISHRKKAKHIVETWEKMFHSSSKEKQVSFLYLANDILQNSRRKGSEFVNEFWKLLPKALKAVFENGDDHGKTAVKRLIQTKRRSNLDPERLSKLVFIKYNKALYERFQKRRLQNKNEDYDPIVLDDLNYSFEWMTGRTGACNEFVYEEGGLTWAEVDIWDERKVFGSRGRILKDGMLDKESSPLLENNPKSAPSITIVKRDAQFLRIKMAVGGMPEKIVSAFQSMLDGCLDENAVLNKCSGAILNVRKIEKDVEDANSQDYTTVDNFLQTTSGNSRGSALGGLMEQETTLRQCIEQLESFEAARTTLVSKLKEALMEQESKLEITRSQLQVARAQTQHASNMQQHLSSVSDLISNTISVDTPPVEYKKANRTSNGQSQQSPVPMTSFGSSNPTAEELHKKTAAEIAAKLAASTSSEQILNAVLSSFVAEEAASKSGGHTSENFTKAKRPKFEQPIENPEMSGSRLGHGMPPQLPSISPMSSQAQVSSFQSMVQLNPQQPTFPPMPSLQPPPPPLMRQYVQTSGMMVGASSYGYGNNPLPPPAVQPHILAGFARPGAPQPAALQSPQPLQPQKHQSELNQQQQKHQQPSGFSQPPGMSFFGQPPAAPVPR